jgi:hypothetical protein
LGEISESDLLKAAEWKDERKARRLRMEAHFAFATLALVRGEADKAKIFFAKCLEQGDPIHYN